jgi:hypothetical protein
MNEVTATSVQEFDASDDFGELNLDDVQVDELPEWLRSMAPAPASQEAPSPPGRGQDQPTPDDLPDWLREPEAGASSASSPPQASQPDEPPASAFSGHQQMDHQPADQFSLVSDDDLPDWLKELSDEDDYAPSSSSSAPTSPSRSYSGTQSTSTALANLYDVPPINRAWSTQGRHIDQDQAAAAHQEFLPLDALSSLAIQSTDAGETWEAVEPEQMAAEDQETRPFTVADEEPEDAEAGDRGKLIARVAILVLFVIVLALLGYIIVQSL